MRDEEASVLRHLREHGDRTATPRPVAIWTVGALEEIHGIAEQLTAMGWECGPPDPYGAAYMLRAERIQDTTEAAIDAMLAEIGHLIVYTGAYLDGWETTVEIGQ